MPSREVFYRDVTHAGLKTFQRIHGTDRELVERRAAAKIAEWNARWTRLQRSESLREQRERQMEQRLHNKWEEKRVRETAKATADALTRAAEQAVEEASGLLGAALTRSRPFTFASLRETSAFGGIPPSAPHIPKLPTPPTADVTPYRPVPLSGWHRALEALIPPLKRKRRRNEDTTRASIEKADCLEYEKDLVAWEEACRTIRTDHQQKVNKFTRDLAEWQSRKTAFDLSQRTSNDRVTLLESQYLAYEKEAIEQYCDLVLAGSVYPDSFPQTYELRYDQAGKRLVVDYELPTPTQTPRLKAVRYIQTRNSFEEVSLSESASRRIYDDAVYQIVIRNLFELFSSDSICAIDAIALNGFVNTVDPGTGQPIRPYIVSIHCTRSEFSLVNLATIEPKACFRRLKGTGSAQLSSIAPVAPLIQLHREDPRFVAGREVMGEVREGTNLAAMPWEDFEHLVRQLFELEFGGIGSEVKVTRASRDGGVDAIAFDPDPIRGGKFVIQAKRYTHTVSVSAVRDLYGAVLNEGAVKGILVTTATFGSDAYEFVRDKPLTLLDGANLLFMLEKHGRKAYIDIDAARLDLRQ